MIKTILHKFEKKESTIGILGLGYVGLPLASAFLKAGFKTHGIDTSAERVRSIAKGRSYIDDLSHKVLRSMIRHQGFKASTRFDGLRRSDVIIICVPTPLSKTRQPDLGYVLEAVEAVGKNLRRGQLVVLESTTYPGTTEENLQPILEKKSGLKVEEDFFLGFSPERVDPANRRFPIEEIPKVVGGVGPKSAECLKVLYRQVFREVIPVSGARTAEMVKLLENTFRSVNIGLINEMAMVCDTLGIDIWEVIQAAKTKPFGFMSFYPGPGIGGHCINIDSMYLAWKARLHGYEPRLIELAQGINDEMPRRIVERSTRILNGFSKPVQGSRILLIGLAYKKNVRDTRESPSLFIFSELAQRGARVTFHDPYVPQIKLEGRMHRSQPLNPSMLKQQDLILILTDHEGVDYELLVRSKRPIFDTRNALESFGNHDHIIRL